MRGSLLLASSGLTKAWALVLTCWPSATRKARRRGPPPPIARGPQPRADGPPATRARDYRVPGDRGLPISSVAIFLFATRLDAFWRGSEVFVFTADASGGEARQTMSSPSGIAAGKGRGNPCRHSLSSWNWFAPAPPSLRRNCLFQ